MLCFKEICDKHASRNGVRIVSSLYKKNDAVGQPSGRTVMGHGYAQEHSLFERAFN